MGAVEMDRNQSELLAARNRAEMALGGIYEISKLLASPNRLELTLSGVLALLASFRDLRRGLIALLTPEGQPELVVGSGWSAANARQYFERLPERAIGQIVVTKMPMVVPDISRAPLFAGYDTGGDGSFELYEDEGINYNYEKGLLSTIRFDWRDGRRELTISARHGCFPGILERRAFTLSLTAPGRAADRIPVTYDGKAVTLRL